MFEDTHLFLYCLKDAVALADAPDMYAFFSESFQLLAGQVVEISDLIHLDDEPVYEKVPVIVIVHKVFPEEDS